MVVVPIGGGGLIAGVATAVKGLPPGGPRDRRRARGIGRDAARARGRRARAPRPGLGRRRPQRALRRRRTRSPIVRELVDEVVLVTEDEIADATRFLYGRAKLACEPAGAAATAALLAGKVAHEQGESVVAVVSGGNVAPETAVAILAGR